MAPPSKRHAKGHERCQAIQCNTDGAKAKSEGLQQGKAKIHNIYKKKASQAQTEDSCLQKMDDVTKEEQPEEQQEEQEGECQEDNDETTEKDNTQMRQMEYYHFWKKLPEAPKAVQDEVYKIKDQPHRSGKRKTLAEMAKAYASQQWDHKLFKSMESLQHERSKAREDIVMPKVIMEAKRGGKSAFEQAVCLANSNVLSRFQIVCFVFCMFVFIGIT